MWMLLGRVVLLALTIRVVRGDEAFLTEPRKCQENCDTIAPNYQVGLVSNRTTEE